MNNTLYLVRGLPGSGKSTFVENTISVGYELHYEADMYFMKNGVYQFDAERLRDAYRWCQESVFVALNCGKSVWVSNTFTTLSEMRSYMRMAEDCNAQLHVFRCAGNYGSVHNVPPETMEKMRNRFQLFEGEIYV